MDTRIIYLLQLAFLIQSGTGVPLQISYEDAKGLHEGSDKVMLIEGDIVLDVSRSAMKCNNGNSCRWSKNNAGIVNVPYIISSAYSANDAAGIRYAMLEFSTLTCINFTPQTTEADYLSILSGSGCWSSVGRTGGVQQVSLGVGCLGHGTIQHELNHALGFFHEQSRSDRDSYVDIHLENVIPGTEGNFMKYNTDNLGLEYDYSSVMHYDRYAFSKNPWVSPTIVPKPDASRVIGQRTGLSNLDIAKINKLYQCAQPVTLYGSAVEERIRSSATGLCRTLLTDPSGTLMSANYPSKYPSNTNCLWLIRVPSNQIFLQFDAFDLQSSSSCSSDYVRIYDGPTKSSPVMVDRACGAGQLPPMISTGNTMLLEFISDSDTQATGFKASYSTVTCGATLTSSTGTVSSPNYPSNYPPSMNCIWAITAPAGFVVSLTMVDFNTELMTNCSYDYLQVFNGPLTTSPLFGKYCGQSIPPTFTSSGNTLLLQFHSDQDVQLKGFLAKYSFVPKK